MATKYVIHAGHRWQVGDGTTVRIWKDRWIPKPSTFFPISQPNTLPLESTVFELIDEDTGEWNATLIKQVFLPDEARTILSMPRSHRRANDRIIWAYTPVLAQPIGDLGGGLRPPLVRGPSNSNNIVYNIIFSFEKKIHTYLWFAKEKITKGPFLIWKKKKKKKKRPVSHTEVT